MFFELLATGVQEQDNPGDDKSRNKWGRFVIGHLLSAAIVIYNMTQLSVCFDSWAGYDDDDDSAWYLDEYASETYSFMMTSLVVSLFADVVSAIVLPMVYGRPFDIKSVHKIPAHDTRHCCGTFIVHFLAPFTWGVELMIAGLTSLYHTVFKSCGGQGGQGLETYFEYSGYFTSACGLLMFGVSTLAISISCCTPNAMRNCCTCAREVNRFFFLTKGPYINYWCNLQGVLWSYRTGSFNVFQTIFVAAMGFLGEVFASGATATPEEEPSG